MRSSGTAPAGTRDEQQAAKWVRAMFARVAPRYDLLNHLLSFNIDRYWRSRTSAAVIGILKRPNARVLDLCCGTGDLMLSLSRRGSAQIYGSDFCHPMLVAARRKAGPDARLFEADALSLPLAAGLFDLITVAFGFRNLANYRQGLHELFRVLRPGGTLAILEFSQPPNPILSRVYNLYSDSILPLFGGWISGAPEAYSYLPASVRKFPAAEELSWHMREAGYLNVRYERMTGGIVALHRGERPA